MHMTSDRKRVVRMARSALLVAGLSAVTLALTLAWQMSIAQAFGASGRLDAFWIALSIPRAIADSFHLGLLTLLFVLVFHRDASSDAAERWRQASAVLNVTLVVTAIAIVALAISADPLVRFMAPGLSPGHHALAASMLRRLTLMLPDLGSEQKNHKLDSLLSEFAEKVARLIEDT